MADYVNQVVDIGAAANDGNGDPVRTAYTKLNDNWASFRGAADWDASTFDLSFSAEVNVQGVLKATALSTGGVVQYFGNGLVSSVGLSFSQGALEFGHGVESRTGADNTYSSTTASNIGRSALRLGDNNIELLTSANQSISVGSAIILNTAMFVTNPGNIFFNGLKVNPDASNVGAAFIKSGSDIFLRNAVASTANSTQMQFYNPNGNIGFINTSGTTTTYSTTSDERL